MIVATGAVHCGKSMGLPATIPIPCNWPPLEHPSMLVNHPPSECPTA